MQVLAKHIDDTQFEMMTRMLEEHPYSSTLAAVVLKELKKRDEAAYDKALSKTAIRIQNRSKLQTFLEETPVEPPVVEEQVVEEDIISEPQEQDVMNDDLSKQFISEALGSGAVLELIEEDMPEEEEDQTPQTVEAVEPAESIVEEKPAQKSEMSFYDWLENLESETDLVPSHIPSPSKAEILDRFVENEAQIVPKRAEFFSPTKAAKESLIDREDIVTETLARVYAGQGDIDKAISTYHKLGLLHPEKSVYFAGLIEELKKEL